MKNVFDSQDLFKTVEIKGDTYRIQKFTAKDGLKLARLVLAKIAPLIPLLPEKPDEAGNPGAAMDDDATFKAVSIALNGMEDNDVDYLADKCLRVCCKMLPAGPTPIIDENGYYGIPEVEYDIELTIRLIVEAIKWGASDFFDGSGFDLKALLNRAGK